MMGIGFLMSRADNASNAIGLSAAAMLKEDQDQA